MRHNLTQEHHLKSIGNVIITQLHKNSSLLLLKHAEDLFVVVVCLKAPLFTYHPPKNYPNIEPLVGALDIMANWVSNLAMELSILEASALIANSKFDSLCCRLHHIASYCIYLAHAICGDIVPQEDLTAYVHTMVEGFQGIIHFLGSYLQQY